MEDFRRKYYRLKFLLVELGAKIDKLENENNFFDTLGNIRSEIEEIQVLKKEIMTSSSKEELEKIDPELDYFTKQIQQKFDNIIEMKKRDLAEVAINLRNLQNSRKLANYNR